MSWITGIDISMWAPLVVAAAGMIAMHRLGRAEGRREGQREVMRRYRAQSILKLL